MKLVKIFFVLFLFVAVVFVSISIFKTFSSIQLLHGGKIVSGKVIDYRTVFISRKGPSAIYGYYPIISFTGDSRSFTFTSDVSSDNKDYQIGDIVQVLYSHDFSQHKIATFSGVWGASLIFGFIGLLFLVISFLLFRLLKASKKEVTISQ